MRLAGLSPRLPPGACCCVSTTELPTSFTCINRSDLSNVNSFLLLSAATDRNQRPTCPCFHLCAHPPHSPLLLHAHHIQSTMSESSQRRAMRACMVCSIVMSKNVRPSACTRSSICLLFFSLPTPAANLFSLALCIALQERRMPQLRGLPAPPGIRRNDRGMHVVRFRRSHRDG